MRVELEFYAPPKGVDESLGRFTGDVLQVAEAVRRVEGNERAKDVLDKSLRFLVDLRDQWQELLLSSQAGAPRRVGLLIKSMDARKWISFAARPTPLSVLRSGSTPCIVFCCVVGEDRVRIIGLGVAASLADTEEAAFAERIETRCRTLGLVGKDEG